MKARKLTYWIVLFCVAVLVLMPDITVNAQTAPGGQGATGQMPKEVGKGPDTQTSEGQPPPGGQVPSNGEIATEQSLMESGCQQRNTFQASENGEVFIWVERVCRGYQVWACLASPDRADARQVSLANEEVRRGECVYRGAEAEAAISETPINETTENSGTLRQAKVQKIREPASSDSQAESDQQQAQDDDVAQGDEEARGEEARGEEARGEENKASNQSQANNSSKQGYGCSANR